MVSHLVSLGLHLNTEKSNLVPARSVEYLGLILDSDTMMAHLTPKRRRTIQECFTSCTSPKLVSVKQWQRLLGLFATAAQVVPLGLMRTLPLQLWFGQQGACLPRDKLKRPILIQEGLRTVSWWKHSTAIQNGVCLGQAGARVTITTDAPQAGCLGRQICVGSLASVTAKVACEPPQDESSLSGPKTLSPTFTGQGDHVKNRQEGSGFLHQSSRWAEISSSF